MYEKGMEGIGGGLRKASVESENLLSRRPKD